MTKFEAALSLALVGDLSFQGPRADHPAREWLAAVRPIFRDVDLAVGNLESPLVEAGTPIPGKATLRGSPRWAAVLREAGVRLVTLANNHTMDYGPAGLRSTMDALREAGVHFVGAGLDAEQARAPALVDINGVRVACLGRTSVEVAAPTYAGDGTPGVAWFDRHETMAAVRRCRSQADLVLLLLHWGLEEYRYPSPAHRDLARELVHAGVDIIAGHHPHVLQGIERIDSAVVAYSLGNFVFSDFEWEYRLENGAPTTARAVLTEQNRQGLLLRLVRSGNRDPVLQLYPTRMQPDRGVRLDTSAARVSEMERLSSAMHRKWYRSRWYVYAIRREWALRLGRTLSPTRLLTKLHRLRPRHLLELAVSLRRSTKIVSERSTNPYE